MPEAHPPSEPSRAPDDESLAAMLRRRVESLLAQLDGTTVEGLYPVVMREVEKSLLQTVLAHTQGRREEAARILGLHRNSLRLRLRAVGLDAPVRRRKKRAKGAAKGARS